MIDSYLKRDDVVDFISRIKNSPKYNTKDGIETTNYYGYINNELSLYILYDALLKYKIIVDDEKLFSIYIEQIDKLFKKINDYESILVGVNKLICYIVSKYLKISDLSNRENKKKIITYVYNKYISNGYYVHGFNSVYKKSIKENGFVSEVYTNKYNDMNQIKELLLKKDLKLIEKDFKSNKTFFTDDYIMGCYYSAMSPGYFSKLLLNDAFCDDDRLIEYYLNGDKDNVVIPLKKFLNNKGFNNNEKEYILNVVLSELKYINSVPKKIDLLLVKRNRINDEYNSKIDDFINDRSNVFDVIDRMLNPKYTNISFDGVINSSDVEIVSFDNFYSIKEIKQEKDEEIKSEINQKVFRENQEFLDSYGKVYIFLIVGSFLVSLGVIISLILILRGI